MDNHTEYIQKIKTMTNELLLLDNIQDIEQKINTLNELKTNYMDIHNGYVYMTKYMNGNKFPKTFLNTLKINRWTKTMGYCDMTGDGEIYFNADMSVCKVRFKLDFTADSNWKARCGYTLTIYNNDKNQTYEEGFGSSPKITGDDIKKLLNDVGVKKTGHFIKFFWGIVSNIGFFEDNICGYDGSIVYE